MRKLAWFSAGFGAACLLACYGFGGTAAGAAATALLLLSLALWLAVRPKDGEPPVSFRKPAKPLSRPSLWQVSRRGLALCLGGVTAFGWFAVYSALFYEPAAQYVGDGVALSGTVSSYPGETSIGGWSVTVSLDGGFTAPDVLIYGSGDWGGLAPGDRISCVARVTAATRMRGDETTYYTAKGVYLLAYCNDPPVMEQAGHVPLRYWPVLCAERLKTGIYAAFDGVAAPIAAAVTLGDKSGLPDQLYSALSRAGLMHTAVVSGLHISFLVAVVLLLCGGRRGVALALVPVLLFYALMAGGAPSALRAVIMQAALLWAPVTGRENDPPSALGLALLVLLILNPFAAASVSLQLSFASVAGILLVTPALSNYLMGLTRKFRREHRNGPWKPLWGLYRFIAAGVSASLGAMLFTVPLIALYFGQIGLLSPIANVLVLWALTLLMASALIIGTLAVFLPGPAALLGAVFGLAAHYARWMALLLGRFPFASLSADNPYCLIWLGAVYLVLLVCAAAKRRPRPLIPIASLAVLLWAAIGLGGLAVSTADLTVAALDVGQGASTALLSGSRTALVDCGGSQSRSAGDIAADWFASLGRTRLDLLVLTHLDSDHFNGVEQLFYRMDVRAVAVPASGENPDKLELLLDWAKVGGAEVVFVDGITEYGFGNAALTLFPPLSGGASNEEGLFALCSAGEFDALITGDADAFVEKMLVKYYPIPDIELLMVGHHGSNGSTCQELLDAVRPEVAVISVGYNSYGHPRQEVLDRLEGLGSKVYRTDLEGTVTLSVRGENVNIY